MSRSSTIKSSFIALVLIILIDACNDSKVKHMSNSSADHTLGVNRSAAKWAVSRINRSTIEFRNGEHVNTHLYEFKYLGQIENGDRAPFLIFSGRDCDECDENISIYIHSPSNGDLNVVNDENRYEYPGTEKDYENHTLVYKARAFFGEVLPGIKGVIWYQRQLMEDNSLQSSVFLVKLIDGLKKDTVFKNTANLKVTLDLLRNGRCHEITGIDYTSEP
jgi:hypothetical protein